ncbi:hypothetical protein [Thermus tenuipuniceus]|uniref:hypothetical protein n=1 Tax=Thermus tenuipuniceus TaxID=2078690 RepID=UPI000CF9CE9B|nr:hypothetical protein [Thermus tenuipuniceus]
MKPLGEKPWAELRALLDPKAGPKRRRRGLRLYAAFLAAFQGMALLALSPFLPGAGHPGLFLLALLGGGWLFLQGLWSLRQEAPWGALVAVGFGGGLFFFLGVMGLLLRPPGLFLLLAGAVGFYHLFRRAEGVLVRGEEAPKGGP